MLCLDSTGQRAKEIITEARENLARMIGGRLQDIIFTSGGTEVRSEMLLAPTLIWRNNFHHRELSVFSS